MKMTPVVRNPLHHKYYTVSDTDMTALVLASVSRTACRYQELLRLVYFGLPQDVCAISLPLLKLVHASMTRRISIN
jgi:hypothetical protein